MAAVLIVWLICAALGYVIGNNKGRAVEGLVLGLLLGVIGLIIIVVLKPKQSASTAGLPYSGGGVGSAIPPAPGTPVGTPAGWHADPAGRHQHRYWNGAAWTEHVADNGESSTDPIDLRG
jgi:predicted MFS family arabinose efflux permease